MEKIEVGEFVRTTDGYIGKCQKIDVYYGDVLIRTELKRIIYDFEVVNHSFNIKDLIEEGDIIKYTPKGIKSIHIDIVRKIKYARSGNETLAVNLYSIGQIDIISIVTKEQFKAMEYEVK